MEIQQKVNVGLLILKKKKQRNKIQWNKIYQWEN